MTRTITTGSLLGNAPGVGIRATSEKGVERRPWAEECNHRVLGAFLDVLWKLIRPAKANVALSAQNRRLSDTEHQELFQSIVDGDPARARATMDAHIRQGRALLVDFARSLPELKRPREAKPNDAARDPKTGETKFNVVIDTPNRRAKKKRNGGSRR
jgi:hypothetical protein